MLLGGIYLELSGHMCVCFMIMHANLQQTVCVDLCRFS